LTCLLPERIVQLHPSTRCNLECAHCYSSSAPGRKPTLDPDAIIRALAVLAEMGYEVLSISGGEPFLYAPLAEVARRACSMGYRVTVVTNGMAVTPAMAQRVAGYVATAAVSLDGRPERHDAIRRKPGAFAGAIRGLHILQAAGIRCGVITCVTRASLEDVVWLYELARTEGVSLFQLRPLALTGRATGGMETLAMDSDDTARTAVVAALLDAADVQPVVQCDLARAEDLTVNGPEQFGVLSEATVDSASVSDLVNPMVISEDGAVLPFVYGMARGFALTTIDALSDRAWTGLTSTQRASLGLLLEDAFSAVGRLHGQFVDWYAILTDVAQRSERPARP
jgi:molybdenum cofactor biosynthesis enzyme MoaA